MNSVVIHLYVHVLVHVQYVLYTLAIYGIDIFKRKLVHVGISLRGLVVP